MSAIINFFSGKKTYLAGLGLVLFGMLGVFFGYHDSAKATEIILEGLTAIFLRNGISKGGAK